MATQEQILAELREAQRHTGLAYSMVQETVPETPGEIPVDVGDNLLQMIQDSPDDSVFVVHPDFIQDVGQCVIPKPCTIKSNGNARLVNASIDARPRDVRFVGMTIDGKAQVTILITGPRTFVENATLNGNPNTQHRGILCNTEGCRILNSKVLNIFKDQDTQAIYGFNGTKDLIVDSCELEASGENIMFGGDTTSSDSSIPCDILITNNDLWKKPEWQADPRAGCKNLLEIKEGRRIIVRGNRGKYSFRDAQSGYAIVIAVRNQYGRSPWAIIEDLLIEDNDFEHMAGAISILATDYNFPSQTLKNLTVRRNWFRDINNKIWGMSPEGPVNGRQIDISRGGIDLTFEENIYEGQSINSALAFDTIVKTGVPTYPTKNLRVIREQFIEGSYGIICQDGPGLGKPNLDFAAPGYTWTDVKVHKSGVRNIPWPTGTIFI